MDVSKKQLSKIPETKRDKNKTPGVGIYVLSIITRKITIPFISVGSNIKQIIEEKLKKELEGKCTVEGFIKYNSIRVINYSSGIIKSKNIVFDVSIECLICSPVEGMKIKVDVINITKAGLRCDVGKNSPINVFVARDHHHTNKYFNNIKIGDSIYIRVIGQRYEINDERISIIAEFMPQIQKKQKKLKIVL